MKNIKVAFALGSRPLAFLFLLALPGAARPDDDIIIDCSPNHIDKCEATPILEVNSTPCGTVTTTGPFCVDASPCFPATLNAQCHVTCSFTWGTNPPYSQSLNNVPISCGGEVTLKLDCGSQVMVLIGARCGHCACYPDDI